MIKWGFQENLDRSRELGRTSYKKKNTNTACNTCKLDGLHAHLVLRAYPVLMVLELFWLCLLAICIKLVAAQGNQKLYILKLRVVVPLINPFDQRQRRCFDHSALDQ